MVGYGNSERPRADCPRRFGCRRRLIAKRPTRVVRAFAACAASRSINSAGMLTCGAKGPTSARPGIARASLRGNSGMRQASRRRCCGVFRHAAADKRAAELWKNAEVDHRVPLYRVWSEHRDTPWPDLLRYWGLPNLQVINRDAHVEKCADEARDRSARRSPPVSTNRVVV